MIFKKHIFFLFFFLTVIVTYSQTTISERKKLRYLKKIERKNDRFVKLQKKKTHKLLSNLSETERSLYDKMDSTKLDSSFAKNSFSKIEERLNKEEHSPEQLLSKLAQPVSLNTSISTTAISENLSSDIKDYLIQQLTSASFLSDTSCTSCAKLKKETAKAKENIAKASQKLERLKAAEASIKKRQEQLKNYGISMPELAGKIKDIDKSCYYYSQGMNGFKDIYTSPAKGIENNLLKQLSFSKDFKLFQTQFSSLPVSLSALSGASAPDMTGYQTKAQVQAMLPQNAPGVTPDIKSQLISNMQNGLTKFSELRDEKPDLSIFKDKPDFKINPYKGLPLRKRLVLGFTFQPQIKTVNEPMIIDVGATLGFKLIEHVTPMVGVSTKVGLGKDIHHLAFSYQGIIARAGFDTKLIYGFSFQGWYEETWRPYPKYLSADRAVNYPQPSLIAGICNTYKISKSVKGTFMIGYDFFYNKHTPYTSPWVIRMGWQ
jgi:hypothetical protein